MPSREYGPLLLLSHGEEFEDIYPGLHLATDGHLASIYTAVPSSEYGPLLLLSHGLEFDEI